jgi:hypothetical protein
MITICSFTNCWLVADDLSAFHRESDSDQGFVLFRVELVGHLPAGLLQDVLDQLKDQLRGFVLKVGELIRGFS